MTRAELRLVCAGAAAIATAYGMARYGYGLLLPDIRADLGLSTAALGAIGTGSYAAYLAATAAVSVLVPRTGPRAVVAAGLALAAVGMVLIATAGGAASLAAGVAVAGTSSGFVFPPFSDAVAARLREGRRARGLSIVSSGTGWGVALAVVVALVAGSSWRAAWLAFAAIAIVVLVLALPWVPGRAHEPGAAARPTLRWSWFVCPRSGPLLAGALLVGLGASVFWTFAVDHVVAAGGLSAGSARLLLVPVGLAGLAGSLAGDLVRRVGARPALVGNVAALAASLLLMAVAPASVPALLAAAVLFGASYNAVVAIEVIWSAKVFAERPSAGLAGVMFTLGAGTLVGPAAAGALAGASGLSGTFAVAAAAVMGAAALLPREAIAPAREPRARLACEA
ncbi:MAG: MFS transporter [Thermoleophilaceae bacterium]